MLIRTNFGQKWDAGVLPCAEIRVNGCDDPYFRGMSAASIAPSETFDERRLFVDVRRALHHLYDPVELRKSPLMGLLHMESVGMLRQVLERCVSGLRPVDTVSQHSDAWRTYRVLHHRYIEQFDQADVASNLGLSIRQLRRQESVALQCVADMLCEKFGLNCAVDEGEVRTPSVGASEESPAENADVAAQEFSLMARAYPNLPTDLMRIIEAVLETLRPLADAYFVLFEVVGIDPSTPPRVKLAAQVLRQALLLVLPPLVRCSQHGRVRIEVIRDAVATRLILSSTNHTRSEEKSHHECETAGRLLAMCNSTLVVNDDGTVCCVLPSIETGPVLIIDDNADAHALFSRYLQDSRYHPIFASNAEEAEALLRRVMPRAVLLDVMLPDVDGWELLGRIRENPRTAQVPVVVCTILPHEQLALTLRAAAFLRKPVMPDRLLKLLDSLTDASEKECR